MGLWADEGTSLIVRGTSLRRLIAPSSGNNTHSFYAASASWINAVERWLSTLERQAIQRAAFTRGGDLRKAIESFINSHNSLSAKAFKRTKAADVILQTVDRANASQSIK